MLLCSINSDAHGLFTILYPGAKYTSVKTNDSLQLTVVLIVCYSSCTAVFLQICTVITYMVVKI